MTPDKRQALRKKHGKFGFRENRFFCVFCLDDDGLDIPYPCDVIKVLDAWEANSKKVLDALDHINTMRVDEDDFEWLQTAEFILKGEL